MKILILDTSDEKSFIALVTDDTVDFRMLPDNSRQSLSLFPTLLALLADNHTRPADLACIAVGNGPGAFTGTRIGVMTAKTMSYASRCPIITFCSLKKYVAKEEGPFSVIGDAKSRGFYVLKGYRTEHKVTYNQQAITENDKTLLESDRCISGSSSVEFAELVDPTIDQLIPLIKSELSSMNRMNARAEVQYLSTP